MKVLILIPCYNEQGKVGEVIRKSKRFNYDILVVDDGSTDKSYQIIKKEKVNCIKLKKNLGKGYALRKGLKYAYDKEFDAVIILDSDGQHNPAEIPNFIKNMDKGDIILGNRMKNLKGMPFIRILANKLSSLIVSSICRQKIEDSQCGFRLLNKKAINVSFKEYRYLAETEIIINASKKGLKVYNLEIETIYRDEVSKINPLSNIRDFFRVILRND